MPYPQWEKKRLFKLNLPSNQSSSGRVSLSKLGAVAMKKVTFQFLSSTLRGSQNTVRWPWHWMEPTRRRISGVPVEANGGMESFV